MKNIRSIVNVMVVLATAITSQAADLRTSLTASDTKGEIRFSTANHDTKLPQVLSGKTSYSEQISGQISFPGTLFGGVTATVDKKVPAMVVMHASGGINDATKNWVKLLNSWGYATLMVDSFNPRGITRTGEDQSQLSYEASGIDGLMSLKLLATHPLVDKNRIGVIGFSRGASAGAIASFNNFRNAVLPQSDDKFAAHVMFYGACSQVGTSSGKPMIELLGALDDHGGADRCLESLKTMQKMGANLEVVVYPDSHHGFDTNHKVTFRPNTYNFTNCNTGSLNFDNNTYVVQGVESAMSVREYQAYRQENGIKCNAKGAGSTDGGNPQTAAQARKKVEEFLAKNLPTS